jgi:hypothetical protein
MARASVPKTSVNEYGYSRAGKNKVRPGTCHPTAQPVTKSLMPERLAETYLRLSITVPDA